MKKIILTIFLSFLLTGCSTQIEQNKTIIENNPDKVSSVDVNAGVNNDKIAEVEKTNKKILDEEKPSDKKNPYHKVIKVVDGDTIQVDIDGTKETLRLIGIDTPETVDPRKPVECFGVEASNKTKKLLTGQEVSLEKDILSGERDKYNRLLRYVFLKDGTSFNKLMIQEGYAHEYTYNNISYKYQQEFKSAEKYARENKLGLWANGVCNKPDTLDKKDTPTQPIAPIVVPEEQPEPTKPSQCECSSNVYNCGDFSTQLEAQLLYDCCGGISNDIHRLDRDKDGVVCESLP